MEKYKFRLERIKQSYRVVEYEEDSGSFVSNSVPSNGRGAEVIEAGKNLARLLKVENMGIQVEII